MVHTKQKNNAQIQFRAIKDINTYKWTQFDTFYNTNIEIFIKQNGRQSNDKFNI